MKTINRFLILLVSVTTLFSCGEPDKVTNNPDANSNQTLVKFNQTTRELGVVIEESGTIEVQVDVSTESTSDRTFQISLIEEQSVFIDELDFTFDDTVTIPAGEFTGSFTVSGTDEGLDQNSEALYVFELIPNDDLNNYVYEETIVQVTGIRVCPIPEDFLVGNYQIEQVESVLGPGFGDTANFETSIVNIQPGESNTTRVFDAVVLPGVSGATVNVQLRLICGSFFLQELSTQIFCSRTPDEEPILLLYGPDEDNPSQYDKENEQDSYTIRFIEDTQSSCTSPANASFKLTKIEE